MKEREECIEFVIHVDANIADSVEQYSSSATLGANTMIRRMVQHFSGGTDDAI